MPIPAGTPQHGIQREVMRILRDVLEIEPGGASPEDSFYDFGGTSLQAMRICTRIHRELGAAVEPEQLFESESIAAFISLIPSVRLVP